MKGLLVTALGILSLQTLPGAESVRSNAEVYADQPSKSYRVVVRSSGKPGYEVVDCKSGRYVGTFDSGFDGNKPDSLWRSSSAYWKYDSSDLVIDEGLEGKLIIAGRRNGSFAEIPVSYTQLERLCGQTPKWVCLSFNRWVGNTTFLADFYGAPSSMQSPRLLTSFVIKIEKDQSLTIWNAGD
jgi:hypothetical protein